VINKPILEAMPELKSQGIQFQLAADGNITVPDRTEMQTNKQLESSSSRSFYIV
jgi:hypothetical protein